MTAAVQTRSNHHTIIASCRAYKARRVAFAIPQPSKNGSSSARSITSKSHARMADEPSQDFKPHALNAMFVIAPQLCRETYFYDRNQTSHLECLLEWIVLRRVEIEVYFSH
jgi:hypothetical protein